jgi:arsenate reductase (thioredoxin)
MSTHNPSHPDAYEQTGAGLRELLGRLNTARTRDEFEWIASEAEQRGVRPGLEPTIETAYGVLAGLARKRMITFVTEELAAAEGETGSRWREPYDLNRDSREDTMNDQIVFVCPHGAAKSVIAAAYCQQLADRQNVSLCATAAGTEPDVEVSPMAVALLRAEGIDVVGYRPRRVTLEELATAHRIIALGCDLGELERPGMVIERWDDVPPPSQDVLGARDRIRDHVEQLVAAIKHAKDRASDTSQGAC